MGRQSFREAVHKVLASVPKSLGFRGASSSLDFEQFVSQQVEVETASIHRAEEEWIIDRRQIEIQRYLQPLEFDLVLPLVEIPAGTFSMGATSVDSSQPEHEVMFSEPFLMAQSPITQSQWRFVADLPQIDRELNPDPSHIKADDHPVESINWFEADEFCSRLSSYTDQNYRLPTEAEWEYACRAGTGTPFYFGETLSPELANYCALFGFQDGPIGDLRGQTTEVGHLPANAFGLFDMHGNVWEWCQDHWHDSYEGAPGDGSAWLTEDDNARRVLRGGSSSTFSTPDVCQSAYRFRERPGLGLNDFGLRVVCSSP